MAIGATPDSALRGWYDRHILPRLIHCVCGMPLIEGQRQAIVPLARGEVLELGFGSGLNLPHYDRQRVTRVWALEPAAPMRALAAPRIATSGLDVRMLEAPAEAPGLPDRSIDTVVVTYTLCTVGDPLRALAEARRVLRDDGRLLFCEHGLAPDAGVRRWQRRIDPLWGRLAGGCHLSRDMRALIEAGGFTIDRFDAGYLPATPRIAGYQVRGSARPVAAPRG